MKFQLAHKILLATICCLMFSIISQNLNLSFNITDYFDIYKNQNYVKETKSDKFNEQVTTTASSIHSNLPTCNWLIFEGNFVNIHSFNL